MLPGGARPGHSHSLGTPLYQPGPSMRQMHHNTSRIPLQSATGVMRGRRQAADGRGELARVRNHAQVVIGAGWTPSKVVVVVLIKLSMGVRGLEHPSSQVRVKTTGFSYRVLPSSNAPGGGHLPGGHVPVLGGGRGHGVGEASGVGQLRAAGDEDLEDMFAIVLDPANKAMLEIRARQIMRILNVNKDANKQTKEVNKQQMKK